MDAGCRELITTNKPTVISEPRLDATMVEDGQGDCCHPNPPCTNEGDWSKCFREADDLLDQRVSPQTGPRWRRWGFTRSDPVQK